MFENPEKVYDTSFPVALDSPQNEDSSGYLVKVNPKTKKIAGSQKERVPL